MHPQQKRGLDGLTVAAVAFIALIILNLFTNSSEGSSGQTNNTPSPQNPTGLNIGGQGPVTPVAAPTRPIHDGSGDPSILAAPYDEYVLTQGQHGFSYGQAAIDIAGGKGVTIKSPINGVVTDYYVDQYGNTTLILDNTKYTVTFLHGNFSVDVGQPLTVGQPIGTEGNNGYTLDMSGRLCSNRDCGYHSHLNVFDKELSANINPLDYFELQPVSELSGSVR